MNHQRNEDSNKKQNKIKNIIKYDSGHAIEYHT